MDQRQHIIDSYQKLILAMRDIEGKIDGLMERNDPSWRELEAQRSQWRRQAERLIEEYWRWISPVELAQCPYCQKSLKLPFDGYDLNGFWWMDRTQRVASGGESCEHFRLLLGAVNLNGRPVNGGLFECLPGPDKPYVVPRILEMPTMQAVMGAIKMHCGYTAYPIAYFSLQPSKDRPFTQGWARKEYAFTLEDGRSGWDVTQESQDFDLRKWIHLKNIHIFKDGRLNPLNEHDPIANVQGKGRNQIIYKNELSYKYC